MSKPTKEVKVKDADEKAKKLNKADCQKGIMDEAMKLYRGETHSIQQMMAYARQLVKLDGPQNSKEK